MIKKILLFLLLAVFVVVPVSSAQEEDAPEVFYSSDPVCLEKPEACRTMYQMILSSHLIETDSPRIKWLNPQEIVDILGIEKGMFILDIGAGKGYFTVPLAKKLEGTGKVYATDIDKINVQDIRKRAQDLGLMNIESVLVQKDGVDPFYKEHSFDLIFASYVYYYLRHPGDYFKALKPSLKKDGRVCIIQPFNNPDLSLYLDVDSGETFRRIFEVLGDKGKDHPIFQRLDQDLQRYILNWNEQEKKEVPLAKREELLEKMNQMLLDRTLFHSILDHLIPAQSLYSLEVLQRLYPVKHYLMAWLANALNDSRVFDSDKVLTEIDKQRLLKLNKMLICAQLGVEENLLPGQADPYNHILAQEDVIVATMEAVGYKLLEGHSLKTAFILIFGVGE